MIYHTALGDDIKVEPADIVRVGDSVAFCHDLMEGLPADYDVCDVLYTELPWRNGFDKFNERAGVDDGRAYEDFMAALSDILLRVNKLTIIVTGSHAERLLPAPTMKFDCLLNGGQAIGYVYGGAFHGKGDTVAILKTLALKYQCIGDFCCGYGRSAKIFHDAGKRFVVSDYNAKCIGYIAKALS